MLFPSLPGGLLVGVRPQGGGLLLVGQDLGLGLGLDALLSQLIGPRARRRLRLRVLRGRWLVMSLL